MQQGFLKFAAIVLGTGLVVVPFLGIDSLPRDLRRQIDAERTAFTQAQREVRAAQEDVTKDLQAEPELFRGIPASQHWQQDIAVAAARLSAGDSRYQELTVLAKQNRRQDRDRAVALLSEVRNARTGVIDPVLDIRKEA